MKNIKLRLLAKDVHNSASFVDGRNCPIAEAAKRQLKTNNVYEGVRDIDINNKTYIHSRYEFDHYTEDVKKSVGAHPNKLLRIIELIPE